jgi:uncharacterized hydrophobic protein (TIGR00271 family)
MENNKLFGVEPTDRKEVVGKLIQESSPLKSFFTMIILATALATLGLLIDNIPVIIGAMLVAPLLSPVLCIGMGIVIFDVKLIRRSVFATAKAVLLSIATSVIIVLLTQWEIAEYEFVNLMKPNLIFVYIAFVSGLAAAYSWGKPRLVEALPGVAISVTLIPPLAGIGVGLAHFDWSIIAGTVMLLIINLVCIILTSVVVFQFMGFYKERKSAEKAIKQEEKILQKEE